LRGSGKARGNGMGKIIKLLMVAALALGLLTGISTNKADAATVSQSSYKLTAYNSKGKKINVNASKGLVVQKVSGKSWYKGSLKYTTYKKVRGKWKKDTKTTTIYVPASKVQKYTSVITSKKPVTITNWIKKIKTVKGYFYGEDFGKENDEEVKTGELVKAGTGISIITEYDRNGYGYGLEGLSVEDNYGKTHDYSAITLEDVVVTQDPLYHELGYANVKYVDYDPKYETAYKTVKTPKSLYKTKTSTQAYTKIYVAPKPGITLSRYNKIKIGMTYNQVVAITHDKGILKSSYSSSRTSSKLYEFRQDKDKYKYAYISFVNGRVKSMMEENLY
jgi:hypothetical protein